MITARHFAPLQQNSWKLRYQKVLAYLLITMSFLCFFAAISRAQSSHDYNSLPNSPGELLVIVFQDLRPAQGFAIKLSNGENFETNKTGSIAIQLSPGEYSLQFDDPLNQQPIESKFSVISGGSVRAIIAINRNNEHSSIEVQSSETGDEGNRMSNRDKNNKQKTGRLACQVFAENKEPIASARVFVRGQAKEWKTDSDGWFVADLPAGNHTFSVLRSGYAVKTVENVVVVEENVLNTSVTLAAATVELNDFVVLSPRVQGSLAALHEERRSATAVTDAIGSEQISKAGDSNAATALRRVAGLSLVGDKYIYVRGLGERYSSVLLNGASLPSPEPSRRVVPLDIFPAGMLASVTVQKTYSADLPGEFGGGTIELTTRGIPEKFSLSSSISFGVNSGTTFANGLTYQGGKYDLFGFDDGTRALPKSIAKTKRITQQSSANPNGFSDSELRILAKSMRNIYSLRTKTIEPDLGAGISVGNIFTFEQQKYGFFVSAIYSRGFESGNFAETDYIDPQRDGGLIPSKSYTTKFTDEKIRLGSTLNLGIELAELHKVSTVTLLVRNTKNSASEAEGFNIAEGDETPHRKTKLRWSESMLLSQQLKGAHLFLDRDGPELEWRYTYSQATRQEPDKRSYIHEEIDGEWRLRKAPERHFADLYDQNHDFGLKFKLPIYIDDNNKFAVSTGMARVERSREAKLRRLKWVGGSQKIWIQKLEEIFVDPNLGNNANQFHIEEDTVNTDSYEAQQQLSAGFVTSELKLSKWTLALGLRYERSIQEVATFDFHSADSERISSTLSTQNMLPCYSLTWEVAKKMPVRVIYSKTIARPDFKELSPSPFWDDRNDSMTRGNKDLKETKIHNIDTRWEWYFSQRESVSIGGFYKKFVAPVEIYQTGALDGARSYRNVAGAINYGLELDARKDLGFISRALSDFTFASNISLIYSRVKLGSSQSVTGEYQTSQARPLQGQSPYVVNTAIEYENPALGLVSSLLYNVNGPRIIELGASGEPDIIEQPAHQLDVTASKKLGQGLGLKLQIKNLLRAGSLAKQSSKTTFSADDDLQFSLAISSSI